MHDVRKSVSEILDKPFTERIDHQIFKPDQKTLAVWALDCTKRVIPYFEEKHSSDNRPKKALETLENWIETGVFQMPVIRKAALDAHAAAKDVEEDYNKYVAHAAGQALGTAHGPTHALGASVYSIRAVAAYSGNVNDGLIQEYSWQLQRLREIIKQHAKNNSK
ncbi:hypothetical protein JXL21_02685 [Candidatus Bathyarchaeota archaeon]|nr:hypothetical protein [Candidatus Bathyarchaeota archaeon]